MEREEDNRTSKFTSCNVTPEHLQTPHKDCGSAKKSVMSQDVKRKTYYSTQNSLCSYLKTPQSCGPFRKDMKSLSESNKRKIESSHNESREKVQRTYSGGKFVNTLIGQWSKHMGMQSLLSQTREAQESPLEQEMKHKHITDERIIQKLQKKLQTAEETISSLSASIEAEMRAKAEILQHLDSDWESITKYYYEISESLKDFRKHKDNLSTLYNDVIIVQQSTVKNLQNELSSLRLSDENQKNIVSILENKTMDQEKRIKEMILVEAEAKKHLDDIKKEVALEKKRLHNAHAEEKLELLKKQENLTLINEELQAQLKKIIEEKQYLSNILGERNEKLSKLEEEIFLSKNKVADLIQQNNDLNAEYTKLIAREEELSKALQLRAQEIDRLRENLNTRQEIESSLAKDLDIIDNKYKNMLNDFTNVNNILKETEIHNMNLEKSLEDLRLKNENKVAELKRKIEHLEQERGQLLSESQTRIKELENTCQVLKEKHEVEITLLKGEFDVKVTEMENTIVAQKSAFTKLNETLNKIKENRNSKANYYHHTQGSRDKLQGGVKEVMKSNEATLIARVIETQSETNLIRQTQEQPFQTHDIAGQLKNTLQDNNVGANMDQSVYSFNLTEINNELGNLQMSSAKGDKRTQDSLNSPMKNVENHSYRIQNKSTMPSKTETGERQDKDGEVKNDASSKKKIFKTRSAGLRQYGTSKKCQYGTHGKTFEK